jgi:hypothetical protein
MNAAAYPSMVNEALPAATIATGESLAVSVGSPGVRNFMGDGSRPVCALRI